MKFKPLPSAEIVREFLDYDQTTGEMRWKLRDRKWFKTDQSCNAWNGTYPGKLAGSLNDGGHKVILIGKIHYYLHRIAWLHATGEDPGNKEIDHKDRDRSNNSFSNLRLATHAQNQCNSRKVKLPDTGVVGVYRNGKGFIARIGSGKKKINLGTYPTIEEAAKAHAHALAKYHGEFAHNAPTH